MTRQEFIEIVSRRQMPVDIARLDEVCDLLQEDADGACELVNYVFDFYLMLGKSSNQFNHYQYYNCVCRYLRNYRHRNFNPQNLYLAGLVYCYYVNGLTETVNYTDKLLNMRDAEPRVKAVALQIVTEILLRSGLLVELEEYIPEIEQLLVEKNMDQSANIRLHMCLMDIYANLGMRERYNALRDAIDSFMDTEYDSILDSEELELSLRIHEAYQMALLDPDRVIPTEVAEGLRRTVEHFPDDYVLLDTSTVFLPLFDAAGDAIGKEEKIRLISVLMSFCSGIQDKMTYYQYLINKLRLDREVHADIFMNYYLLMQQYYDDTQNSLHFEIENRMAERKVQTLYERARRENKVDHLTGMGNQRAFLEEWNSLKARGAYSGFIFLVIDINRLKDINNIHGHVVGDDLIRMVASNITRYFGVRGKCFRVTGERFEIISTYWKRDFEDAYNSFRAEVDRWIGPESLKAELSCGYSCADELPGVGLEELKSFAERIVYEGKNEFFQTTGFDRRGY